MVKRSLPSNAQRQLLRTPALACAPEHAPECAPAPRLQPPLPRGPVLVPPGLRDAPLLDRMCSHFVLQLVARQGARFHLRRDLNALLALAGRHLVWPQTVLRRLRTFLEQRCRDHELWDGQATLTHSEFLERFGTWDGPYEEGTLFFYLDDYAREAPKDVMALLAATGTWLGQTLAQQRSRVEDNIDTLASLLQLNDAERALLLYGTLARYQRDLRSLLVEFKVNNAQEAHTTLAEVAGLDPAEVGEALRAGSRLERIGLVDHLLPEHSITDLADLMKVSERLPPVLMREYRDRRELMAVFTRPAPRSALDLSDFEFVRDDALVLRDLLREAVARHEPGVNVLIYGPPGTGKTELARVATQAAGLELYEVECADRDGHALSGRDRYRSLQIAQGFLQGTASAALLFDEVEDVFPPASTDPRGLAPTSGTGASVGGKAWVNQVLETNPVPTLWVTNRIEQIDPAFRRRFAYHLELQSPPPGAREQLVRKALDGAPVSDTTVARLTQRPGLTPAQIGTALRFARLVAHGRDAPDCDELMERQLRQADRALGRRGDRASAPSPLGYELQWLHTESRHPIERVVEALRARGHGTLCFHGLPGTGKTALAEHLADALGRPLMRRQASDLMGKYVGETEQRMAAMFAEASAEQAVLLLDEADSFLLDRRDAFRRHEVSEVNEMLQGMERHRGVFICTTNLMERLDSAALRRFTFKIAFLPLRPAQRAALLAAETLGDAAAELPPDLLARLQRLDQLCLGDYAAVKRQCEILDERLTPSEFLAQLEAEHRLKPVTGGGAPMGFV